MSISGIRSPFGSVFNVFSALTSFNISSLLEGASQLIMHPLEYGSMFQDRTGTIPVTESGQLVGLALDWGFAGKKPEPGPEFRGLGVVSTIGSPATLATYNASTGAGTVYRLDGSSASGVVIPVDVATFQIDIEVISGIIQIRGNSVTGTILAGLADGRLTYRVHVSSGEDIFIASGANASGGSFVLHSVRELPGYHATAISDSARGIFRDVGGKRWVEYNGVNTAYKTPVLPVTGVDKVQMFAGLRKLSDAVTGLLVEMSAGIDLNAGSFNLRAPGTAGANSYSGAARGANAPVLIDPGAIAPAPATNVISLTSNISSDLASLRVDGTQVAQSTADQGTGNYNPAGTYPLYYGARTGTFLFFNGYHYRTLGPIVRFGTNASPEQIAAAEAYYTAGLPS